MISVIICSVNKNLLNQLKLNIAESIGIEYEIIAIDNSNSNTGICEVYNRAGARAKFPILCFIHEDILFHTPNWGQLIRQHLDNPETGLLGMAGGDTKGIVPSSWSTVFKSKEMNLIQYKKGDARGKHIFISEGNRNLTSKKVVSVDGFFMCTRKEIFKKVTFDQKNLKGFHGYDIDFSLQIFGKYDVVVIFDVLVHHYSAGNPDRAWLESTLVISKKWKKYLPISVYPLTKDEFNFYHWKSLQVFLYDLFRLRYPYYRIIFYYLYFSFTKYFRLRRFLSMGKYIMLSIYKKPITKNHSELRNASINKMEMINYN